MKNFLTKVSLFIIIASYNLFAQISEKHQIDSSLFYIDLFNTSMNNNADCYRIPSLITAPNGDLIAAIDERIESCGDLHQNKDINIVIKRSSDNGKTWSDIERIVDFPFGESASDPSMIVDAITNEIFLFYNFMDLEKEPRTYYLHVIKSCDNGKTWSKPIDITSQITLPEWKKDFKFITSGHGIQTKSGKLLHTIVNLNNGLHVFGSDDHGKNWYLINAPITPGDESKIIELSDGKWMINSRVNKNGYRFVHISNNDGQTWETYKDSILIDPACNASLLNYKYEENGIAKSCLLFSNAKHSTERKNMTISISFDEGKTWSKEKLIYSGSSAYSTLTILQNGDIGLFFEKDEYTKNVFVKIPFDYLIN